MSAKKILAKLSDCPPGLTYEKDIKTMFTADDIAHMKQVTGGNLALDNYNSTKIWASAILARVQDKVKPMPPPPGKPWTKDMVNKFACWVQQGSIEK